MAMLGEKPAFMISDDGFVMAFALKMCVRLKRNMVIYLLFVN